jgi:prepilin-type N-terminal cleavage/methylation domain-containing protein
MQKAFSLVELSIVLVILGLLTGGILAGQSLIRASELRSYTADITRYSTAYMTFRDQYSALPGDISSATAYWGVLAGTGSDAACQNTAATGLPTCNGSGDGRIVTNTVTFDERFRFFQHLANAGLIEGSYTGKTNDATPGSFYYTLGVNVPSLKGGATHTPLNYATPSPVSPGVYAFPSIPAGNYMEFRMDKMMTPEEAWGIDTKLDDGKPGYGMVLGPQSSWTYGLGCTTTDDPATSVYALTSSAKVCRPNFSP